MTSILGLASLSDNIIVWIDFFDKHFLQIYQGVRSWLFSCLPASIPEKFQDYLVLGGVYAGVLLKGFVRYQMMIGTKLDHHFGLACFGHYGMRLLFWPVSLILALFFFARIKLLGSRKTAFHRPAETDFYLKEYTDGTVRNAKSIAACVIAFLFIALFFSQNAARLGAW